MNQLKWKSPLCFLLTAIMALVVCHSGYAQSKGDYRSNESGSNWTGHGWQQYQFCEDIKDYAPKPDSVSSYSLSFAPATLDKLGNHCTISGTLGHQIKGSNENAPVNWFQGISVYLLRKPNEAADWSRIIDDETCEVESVILKNDGSFSVDFDLREIERNPLQTQSFQVAISLARHSKNKSRDGAEKVVWTSYQRVIPNTIQKFPIPASPAISKELRLVDRAHGWPFYDPDSRKLIQAVNALQPLGKKKALEIIKEYVAITDNSFDEHEIAFWIIRLLFEPVDLEDRIPSPGIAVVILNDDRENNHINWPLGPIELVDGIPFMVGQQIGMGGMPEHPMSHIRWVERFGVIRQEPIKPSGNPLLAAQKLMATEKFKELNKTFMGQNGVAQHVKEQAFKTLGIEIPEDEHEWPDLNEAVWNEALKSDKAKYEWNASSQQFEPPEVSDQ